MQEEQIYNELKKKNIELDDTLLPGFLSKRYLEKLPIHVIEYCVNYKDAQSKIINMSNSELDTLSKIISYCSSEKQDWIPVAANYVRTLDNPNFRELIISLSNNELTLEEIKYLIFITNNYGNFYDIKTYEELKDFPNIKSNMVAKYLDTEDPNIILITKYGISYDKAKKYYKRYGKDLNELPDCEEKDFLQDIENIIKGNSTKDRSSFNIDLLNNLDSRLRNLFVSLYNKKLYKISGTPITKTIYNNQEIPIYDAGTDFYMSIYSFGMASNCEEPENFSDSWNRPITKSENFCNSIIASSSIRTSVKQCIFGFSFFAPNDIELLAANDLGSGGVEYKPDVTNFYNETKLIADVEFRIPKEIINYTRYTNNEVFRKRRRVVNGHLEKVNPDYIVYLKNRSDMNHHEDPIWHKSLKAAVDFSKNGKPLPIVVIDCEKCLQHNLEILESKTIEFESSYEYSNLIREIIELTYTLLSGYYNLEYLRDKYLNNVFQMDFLNRILNQIKRMSVHAPNNAIACLDLLQETLELEHIKKLASPYWIKKSTDGQGIPQPTPVYEMISDLRNQIISEHSNLLQNK